METRNQLANENSPIPQRISRRIFLQSSLVAGFGIFTCSNLWHAENTIDFTFHEVRSANSSENYLTVTQLSDLHLPTIVPLHKTLAAQVNKISPDIIVITGDAIDDIKDLELLNHFLKLLSNNIFKLAIMGNHEWMSGANPKDIAAICNNNNGMLLLNKSFQFTKSGKHILFTGIDSLQAGRPDIQVALHKVNPSPNHILLGHCPQLRDIIAKQVMQSAYNINLMLSGHTHGGQINILGLTPLLPAGSGRYVEGWYKNNYIPMFVSRGIGTAKVHIRIGATPEVAIVKYYLT